MNLFPETYKHENEKFDMIITTLKLMGYRCRYRNYEDRTVLDVFESDRRVAGIVYNRNSNALYIRKGLFGTIIYKSNYLKALDIAYKKIVDGENELKRRS